MGAARQQHKAQETPHGVHEGRCAPFVDGMFSPPHNSSPSSLDWWRILSNGAYLLPAAYAWVLKEWARTLVLLALTTVSTGHHYVTDTRDEHEANAWTKLDHAFSVIAIVAFATLIPFSREERLADAFFNLCAAAVILSLTQTRGVHAPDTNLLEACTAGVTIGVAFLVGYKRVWSRRFVHPVIWLTIAATLAFAGLVMFQYNFGEALMHGFWHVDTALLFGLLLYAGRLELK